LLLFKLILFSQTPCYNNPNPQPFCLSVYRLKKKSEVVRVNIISIICAGVAS